jgi:hypothetical protein
VFNNLKLHLYLSLTRTYNKQLFLIMSIGWTQLANKQTEDLPR